MSSFHADEGAESTKVNASGIADKVSIALPNTKNDRVEFMPHSLCVRLKSFALMGRSSTIRVFVRD